MYHTKTAEETLSLLGASKETGLKAPEAETRIKKFGSNELPEPKKEPLILKFIDQFKNLLVMLLIGATIVSFLLGEKLDAIAILTIVLINAVLGFVQEYKAEKALEALKKLSTLFTKVLRDGKLIKIEAKNLVPGDIIHLEAGDKVPADARILEAFNLEVSEAILTGESHPVKKLAAKLENENMALGDKKNLLFKDTAITFGRTVAVVYATGVSTEVGKISTLLKEEEAPETPLQIELEKVGKNLSIAAILIIVVIFVTEIFVDFISLRQAFLTSVSLAVAAIPEGLPAVITVVLAIGVTRLAAKKAIIRKLPAVETLGATTHILTDKTGTLTQNRMVVTKIIVEGKKYSVDGEGYKPEGNFYDVAGAKVDAKNLLPVSNLLKIATLCNDAVLNFNKDKNNFEIVGDITEGALVVAGEKIGFEHNKLRAENKRVYEIPFSSETKTMATVHEINVEKLLVCVKGAPEMIVRYCNNSIEEKHKILKETDELSAKALRSLGFASKEINKKEFEKASDEEKKKTMLSGLHFAGIASQMDPLRPEIRDAVLEAKEAGITTVMVTGDHKLTAVSIAKELRMIKNEDEAITGEELSRLNEAELLEVIKKIKVFARVSPEEKLKLVKAFKKQGAMVAVTGDGVNDAPAIKAADIGIAMGIEGTDVAKEASDMVLQNDNYATIVAAVKEGRVIFDNLIKFITYLISCNISEIFIIFAAAVMRLPVPLLPIHLLWINLITDGFPALALGMEPGEKDIMQRKPRAHKYGVLTKERWVAMAIEGVAMGVATYIAFVYSYNHYGIEVARTVTFLTLNLAQLVHSLNSRSEKKSLFEIGILQNKFLFWVFVISILIQLPVIYTKVGEVLFDAAALNARQLMEPVLISFGFFIFVEILKVFKRRISTT